MRAFDIAIAALALRTLPTQPQKVQRRLAAAIDDADPAMLGRDALNRDRAALIASLWPEARPCVVPTRYEQFPAPALFGAVLRVCWRPPRREEDACESRTGRPRVQNELQIAWAA
jgi:hypothetical protein